MTIESTKQKILARAAANFMLTQVSISVWKGVSLNKSATAAAASSAGVSCAEAGRLYVDILGEHHRDLKVVTSAFAELRTYLYANTVPFAQAGSDGQRRGDLLIYTMRVPEVMARLTELKTTAVAALEAFLLEYDSYVSRAISGPLGSWAADHYPSAEEVRGKFNATIETPRPMTVPDAAQMSHLPASMAAEFAEQHAAGAIANLEGAKTAAIDAAAAHMKKVVTQLTDGKRLHDSLITLSTAHAHTLLELAEGTDNDPRLIELAEMVRKQVANVTCADSWAHSHTKKREAKAAAATAVKGLTALSKEIQSAPAEVQLGGAMADLW